MESDKVINFHWLIVIALLFCTIGWISPVLNKIGLFVIIPLIFIYISFSNISLFKNKYILLYIAILLWIFVSGATAYDYDLMLKNIRVIVGTFLVSCIFYLLAQNKRYIPWLYLMFLLIVFVNFIYTQNYLLTGLDIGKERLGDKDFNANRFGYYLFYSICSMFVYGEIFSGYKKKLFRLFLFILIAIIPYFAIITASRQIVIIVVPFALYSLIHRYTPFTSVKQFVKYSLLITVFTFFIVEYYLPIYESSLLSNRLMKDVSEDARFVLLQESLLIGREYPILGVGPGNSVLFTSSRSFTHNSYTELFVSSGILPMMIFILLVASFINAQWRRFRKTKDKLFLYFFVTGTFWAIYNFFYVFYSDPWLMCFLFLLLGHSNQYYIELYNKNEADKTDYDK